MPRLPALGRRGVVFEENHSVFPTVTRVNASSISTGAYPETHGRLGNTVYSERAFPTRGINPADWKDLAAMEKAEGVLLTAPTMGEVLEKAGKRFDVFSAGSSGSAMLLNHPLHRGTVINPDYIRPESIAARVTERIGAGAEEAVPNGTRNRWAVDAYLQFGRVEDALRAQGRLDRTNIIVTSDQGFSTHTGELKLAQLAAPFAETMPDGTPDIVVTEGAINLRGRKDAARIGAIVAALQRRPEVGAIFTRPRAEGATDGIVPGTLALTLARGAHARAGEILVSANWSDEKNDAGVPGKTAQGGVTGHGTSSRWDVHNTLMAAGPDFRERMTSAVPASNVDLAPTLLRLLGVAAPATMTGRVLDEALRSGPSVVAVAITTRDVRSGVAHGHEVTARIATVAGHDYLDFTRVSRSDDAQR